MSKKIAIVLFVAILGGIVFAQSATKISFWYSVGGNVRDAVESAIKEYNASQSKYVVEGVFAGNYEESLQKIMAAIASGNAPVLIQQAHVYAPQLLDANVLEVLDPYIAKDKTFPKDLFIESLFQSNVFNGKTYGIAFNCSTPIMYYNKDLFRKVGLNPEKFPETWEELRETAKKLTKPDRPGILLQASMNTNDANIFEGAAYSNGGRWISEDGKTVVINDQGVVDVLQLFIDLQKDGSTAANITETDFAQAGTLFMQKQGAMWHAMSWVGAFEQGQSPENLRYGVTKFPQNPKPSGSFPPAASIMTPTTCFMVSTLSQIKKEAMEYVDFWATPEAQSGWDGSVIWGRVPALKANWETEAFKKRYPDWYKLYKEGKMFEGSLPMPMFRGLTEIEKLLSTAIQEALLGKKSPKEALDAAAQSAQKIYSELNA